MTLHVPLASPEQIQAAKEMAQGIARQFQQSATDDVAPSEVRVKTPPMRREATAYANAGAAANEVRAKLLALAKD